MSPLSAQRCQNSYTICLIPSYQKTTPQIASWRGSIMQFDGIKVSRHLQCTCGPDFDLVRASFMTLELPFHPVIGASPKH
eukprot:168103-Amphidinium_carterae.1